ncbi:hypothetical protein QAD02_012389 [Eretmocerus hayati]|uniref:Uncharacterized protein n=1 Tax=Eretmocerus hayati TaxID=131215 RepID=A0ACC2P2B7_9HYME|nr:hypothetical protein QAD02_012389 [Eretmocerus hayati]
MCNMVEIKLLRLTGTMICNIILEMKRIEKERASMYLRVALFCQDYSHLDLGTTEQMTMTIPKDYLTIADDLLLFLALALITQYLSAWRRDVKKVMEALLAPAFTLFSLAFTPYYFSESTQGIFLAAIDKERQRDASKERARLGVKGH